MYRQIHNNILRIEVYRLVILREIGGITRKDASRSLKGGRFVSSLRPYFVS